MKLNQLATAPANGRHYGAPAKPKRLTPSHSIELERAAVCSILLRPEVLEEVAQILSPADFYADDTATIYRRILELRAEGKPIDTKMVFGRLKAAGDDELHGVSAGTLAEILQSSPTSMHAAEYAKEIKRLSNRRKLHLLGEELQHDAADGRSLESIIVEATAELDGIIKESDGAGQIQFAGLTCAELDRATYKTEYLIDRMLVAGQPCIFGGSKKAMKTTLLSEMTLSLGTGTPFLDKLRVARPVRVAFMSGESGMSTIQETARRQAKSKGFNLSDIEGIIWSEQLPQFSDLRHRTAFQRFLTANRIEVAIIDPAYLALDSEGGEGSMFAMGSLLRGMNDVCRAAGTGMILAHHTRGRGIDHSQPPELEHLAWAGFAEYCRQWILVGRRERYEPGTGEHRLWLTSGGSAGHSSLYAVDISEGIFDGHTPRHWDVQVLPASDAREGEDERKEASKLAKNAKLVEAAKKRLCRTLIKHPKGDTKRAIMSWSGVSGTDGNQAIAALFDDDIIEPCEIFKGNRKTPYEGIRLKTSSNMTTATSATRAMRLANPTDDHQQCDTPL